MKKAISIIVVVAVLLIATFLVYRSISKPEVKTQEQLQEQQTKYDAYVNPDAIISALDAQELIETDQNLVVVDVSNSADFALGHIEGAVNVWRPAYGAEDGEFEFDGMRATPETVYELLGEMGIDAETTVLVYSRSPNHDASRFAWLLNMYGHENVKLLDGGYIGWQSAGLNTVMSRTNVESTQYEPANPVDEFRNATLEEVIAALDEEDVVILDTRGYDEFTGERHMSPAVRAGRIPGSIWIGHTEFINDEDKTFKTAQEMTEILAQNGITADQTVIAYCQSGVRSSLVTFALAELLGYENAKNYDGSWIEWAYNEDLDIEIGE